MAATASFVYDGDNNRVKGNVGGVTTTYVGNYFEWAGSTSTMKKYYYAGGVRVAMRTGAGSGSTGLQWLVGDHLGSTAITANASGTNKDAELRYKAWGENRYTSGTTPTTYRFTGQREEAGIGLYWFNSRWYDSSLSRWTQPDTLVPVESQGTQAWDRYAFVNNNPVRYTDPSGHDVGCSGRDASTCGLEKHIFQTLRPTSNRANFLIPTSIPTNPYGVYKPATPVPVETSNEVKSTPLLTSDQKAKVSDWLSNATSIVPTMVKGVNNNNLPGLNILGGTFSGYAQWQRDSDLPISVEQKIARAAVVSGESLGITYVSNAVGVATGVSTGEILLGVPGYVTGFFIAANNLKSVATNWNENRIFPAIDQLLP